VSALEQKKVVVAMSGGVDSSVAAALLVEQGLEVTGVTMNLFSLPKKHCRSEGLRSCCGWKSAEDAQRVAMALGIPHFVADMRTEFERRVIADFCSEYSQGRTPNPCIRCNEHIKFGLFLKKAKGLGAEVIATGHHARIEYDPELSRYLLKKGRDPEKDQSYFLYPLTQRQLSFSRLPVGELTKKKVREKARKLGLPVADKEESQEICFVPEKNYPEFLKSRISGHSNPGPIVDLDGRVLGEHKGIIYYTIGQRKGMGIAAPHPLYVLDINPQTNTITVGRNEGLYKKELVASSVNLISLQALAGQMEVRAKIRYKHAEAKALITPAAEGKVSVEFEKPQRAITPGQAVVFYDGDVVIGGGIIDRS
jgi:tRNA-specific 2-thiouridylase